MINTYTLKNGLRLVVKRMEGLLSVSMGVLVGAGAAYESDDEDGISHYIEHMQFKGTLTRTTKQISDAFDDIGAQVNAFTGKDMTCFYSKATESHTEEAFAILSDLFLNATFPEDEAKREKEVICEEISMNEDTPEDLCLDILAEAMYGKTGYGRNILGTTDNVRSFSKAAVDKYKAELYQPENMVVCFAGAIDFEKAKDLTEKYFGGLQGGNFKRREKKITLSRNTLFKHKKIEQVHLALGYPSVTRSSRDLESVQIMNTAVGSGMSSRLFQEVREKLGLAYTVYSYGSHYAECGHMAIYAGVNAKNVQKAYDAILRVLQETKKEGITKEEFSRAREQIRSNGIFAQESTSSQMLWYGRYMLHDNKVYDFEELEKRYDDVTLDDVMRVLNETFVPERRSAALVGPASAPLSL
jgi:predicted Zn-dependent peptidase